MSAEPKSILTNKDPKAGCVIMVIIALIIGGLITMALVTPFLQSKGMKEFTQEGGAGLITKEALPAPSAGLKQKLGAQQSSLSSKAGTVQLVYTTAELNEMIRAYEEGKELQGTLAVKQITPGEMHCDISFPLNVNPLSSDKSARYLNGVLKAVPAIKNDELILKVHAIESAVGEVPEGFLNHLQEYRVMHAYTNHEAIGRVMFGCESITLGEDKLTLQVNLEKFADPKAIEPAEDNSEKGQQRRLLMPVMSFIMIGGLFFFMLRRRNAKEAKKWQEQADKEE